MTNPAEKIRQVVERKVESLNDAFPNRHHTKTFNNFAEEVITILVDAIQQDEIYLAKPEDTFEKGFNQGVGHALFILKEARTSITNSTHE